MKRLIVILMTTMMMTGAAIAQTGNPFFEEWKTPFGVPPFEQIRNEHFMPAYQRAMEEHKKEIDVIIKNPSAPDFENTILAFDQSGRMLEKVGVVFGGLNAANTNKEMQEIARQLSPLTTQHSDDINLNPDLFRRVSEVYKNMDQMKLDPVQRRLIEEMYKGFVRGGANLDASSKEKLRTLNKEINMLQITFGQNLLAETNAFQLVIENREELSGLPENVIATAFETGKKKKETTGKWVFTLQNPSVIPFLQFSDMRSYREKILTAYLNRGNNNNEQDNKAVIQKLVALRAQKAHLLGYSNFAAFVLEDRMAKTTDNVYGLLNEIWPPALEKANEEAIAMKEMMERELPGEEFSAWDWRYYSEKQMKARYALDEEMLKPYFKLDNVLEGVFFVANKLYGITFSRVKDAPVYHKEVQLYECKDKDDSHLGVLYFDFHPRESKRGGAWCGSYRPQSYMNGKRVAPISTIVCNFTAATPDEPALLTADETETLFHEFGHALHGLFRDVKYRGLGGVPRDFVELPSQIMEHWAFEPEVLKVYAKHYFTGESIPQDLVTKIVESGKFGQGFKTTEYLAASFLDMDYHVLNDAKIAEILTFEDQSMKKIGLLPQIPPRYRSTYFQHTMTGGYTAGYYSYIWAEVLDADAFEAFQETGNIFNQEIAESFRRKILERGGSVDAMEMYIEFRGKEPGIEALLKNRGLR